MPVRRQIRQVPAGQTTYVSVSAIVIAGEEADQLFVEWRMFVQVKEPKLTSGRAWRGGTPGAKARAHAVPLAGRFNHVENNSAVKNEKKERAEIIKQGNGFTKLKAVGLVGTVEDPP